MNSVVFMDYKPFDGINVPNKTWVKMGEVALHQGIYIIDVIAVFPNNATGAREIRYGSSGNRYTLMSAAAINGDGVRMHFCRPYMVSNASETFEVFVWHSGNDMIEVGGGFIGLRIR